MCYNALKPYKQIFFLDSLFSNEWLRLRCQEKQHYGKKLVRVRVRVNVQGRGFLFFFFFPSNIFCNLQDPSQHFNFGSTLFQGCGLTIQNLKWNKIRRRIFRVVQRWYNFGVRVETALNYCCKTSMQPFSNVAQRCFNVNVTLSQRCFNVASTLVKAISKPIWLVKSMDLQKDWWVLFY